jgi:hypothetical protein
MSPAQPARAVDRHPVPPLVETDTWDRAQAQLARNAAPMQEQHEIRLSAALSAHLPNLRPHHVRPHLSGHRKLAGVARLSVPRQGLYPDRKTSQVPSRNVKAEEWRLAWDHVTGLLAIRHAWSRDSHTLPRWRPLTESALRTSCSATGWSVPSAPAGASWMPTRPAPSAWPRCPSGGTALLRSDAVWNASSRTGSGYVSSMRRPRRYGPAWRPSAPGASSRLESASLADKQAILQLVIERVIVGDGSLEIRHVIPLSPGQPSASGVPTPHPQLRSNGVPTAALPCGPEHLGYRSLKTSWASEMTSLTPRSPRRAKPRRRSLQKASALEAPAAGAEHLAPAVAVQTDCDGDGHRDDAACLAHLHIGGVQLQVGPITLNQAREDACTRLSISAQSREIWLLEMP